MSPFWLNDAVGQHCSMRAFVLEKRYVVSVVNCLESVCDCRWCVATCWQPPVVRPSSAQQVCMLRHLSSHQVGQRGVWSSGVRCLGWLISLINQQPAALLYLGGKLGRLTCMNPECRCSPPSDRLEVHCLGLSYNAYASPAPLPAFLNGPPHTACYT